MVAGIRRGKVADIALVMDGTASEIYRIHGYSRKVLPVFAPQRNGWLLSIKMVAKWRWDEWMLSFLDNRFVGVSIISVIPVQVR